MQGQSNRNGLGICVVIRDNASRNLEGKGQFAYKSCQKLKALGKNYKDKN